MNQKEKDNAFLEKIKKCVSTELFTEIKFQLEESENHFNYRIVDEPVGVHEDNIWVDQTHNSLCDTYSGTVTIKITSTKYLMWDFYM